MGKVTPDEVKSVIQELRRAARVRFPHAFVLDVSDGVSNGIEISFPRAAGHRMARVYLDGDGNPPRQIVHVRRLDRTQRPPDCDLPLDSAFDAVASYFLDPEIPA